MMKTASTLSNFAQFTKLILIASMLTSCVPSVGNNLRSRDLSSNAISGGTTINQYYGKVLTENPIVLTNNSSLSTSFDLNKLTSVVYITNEAFLKGNKFCLGLDYCFEVKKNKESPSALQSSDGKWGYNVYSPEFLQVNSFYHVSKLYDQFFENIFTGYSMAYDFTLSPQYDTALPLYFIGNNNKFNLGKALSVFADCNTEFAANNAYFDKAGNSLCMGYTSEDPKLKWAQDNTIIYHELGHYFQHVQVNIRNANLPGPKADMGTISNYDEASSIGEGISDYFSYYVNGRTHWAEWGAGKYLQSSRPISESDSSHVAGVAAEADKRLSYPQFINYNPNNPEANYEDIHHTGMIISHYLVALSNDLQSSCKFNSTTSRSYVMHLVTETLAELGDLTSMGTELNALGSGKVNLSAARSLEWFSKVNPINFRSFMQTFAKNLKNTLGNPALNRCNGSIYNKDQIESLIDQYGLLLFRTYNENRNLPGVNSTVNSLNRKKTQFISKEQLVLDPTPGASVAFVVDNRELLVEAVKVLKRDGYIQGISEQTPGDLGFNNDNGKISPGEIVAVALNLFNKSNATMGGVQVLANDWNHADSTGKPYQFPTTMSNDRWPLVSEGAVAFGETDTIKATSDSDFAPICFIQSNENNATKWISQKEFKEKMALDSSYCLNKNNDGKDCFIRAIKGADQAFYSKIAPNSNWGKTLADPKTGKAPTFTWGNVLMFEVSKNIPPGTVIDCRLRARFTNCEDCFHNKNRNNYDFNDTDYNGPTPFKILHLQIPITD